MPGIPYNSTVPVPSHFPGNDVNEMQQNTGSINTIWGRDHYTFNNDLYGQHQFNTFPLPVVPSSSLDPSGVVYTKLGTAASSSPQLFFQNAQANFHISPIKAWGLLNPTGVQAGQAWNIISVSYADTFNRLWTVTMNSGAVNGTSYAIIATPMIEDTFVLIPIILSSTQFTFRTSTISQHVAVMVLQI